MREIKIVYSPHEKQKRFHESQARFRAFIGGVGSGKTRAGCIEALKTALRFPSVTGIVVAPTYRMLSDATQQTFFEICPKDLIRDFSKGEQTVSLVNGSKILFRSCDDPEKLRGPNLGWFYGDEVSLWQHSAWKILLGRIRLAPSRGWVTTTPKGFNWVYSEFAEKQRENYASVYCSSRDNPYLPPDFVDSLIESYSGVFADQEIEGKFVGMEGLVYSGFSRDLHVVEDLKLKKFHEYVMGVDWGFSNPSAISVIGVDGDKRCYVVEEFYKKRVLIEDVIEVAKEFAKKYSPSRFFCDPSEPQFIQKFRDAGLRTFEADNQVLPGINKVSAKLEKKGDGKPAFFVHQKCVNTLMEFENYCYPEAKENRPEQENPLKIHDHLLDSIRYAVVGLSGGASISLLEGGEGTVF